MIRVYPEVFLDQRDGEFIPDILLQGEGGHKLYVEVVVTHSAEEKKQTSGVRILEVKIESEDYVEMLRSGVLSLSDERVHGYNLRMVPAEGDFKEMCPQEGLFFHLDVHGAASQAGMSYSVLPDLQAKGGYIEAIPNLSPEVFLGWLRHVLNEGREVHHCWLCVHHGMERHISNCGYNQSISGYWPTGAVDCEFFKRWSAELVPGVLDWVLENLQKRMAKSEPMAMEPTAPHPLDWTGKCELCGKVTSDWYVFDRKTGKCKCNACGRGKEAVGVEVFGVDSEPP
ncbi:hypothetical protein KOM00_20280 [Geomonas sp. Red69]|uniref:hypothetical protein n=1 Tax=Geomonas diazotrophica TaxID=2843197 RepID=UPI001C11027C|nr:hypothetical protein [Geomonas diazotrophica]MBU5639063.1 hypothetical protein [Geomonas diazotrophica]